MLSVLMFTMIFMLKACSTDPEPINWGTDQCEHCKMTIMDQKFGAEIVTKKGKVFKFDAAECMLNYVKAGKITDADVSSYVVIDASNPGNFTAAQSSYYLISENYPSPMGANLSAFNSKAKAEEFQKQFRGDIKTWEELLLKFKVK